MYSKLSNPKADAALFRAYLKGLAYLERKKKDKMLRDESNLPEILFAGVESHGTRCPIKFKIHREPNSQDASVECTVNGRSVARLALGKAIADHMAGIVSLGSQFSGTELIVECWSCKRDGVLVDLPGLVDNLTQAAAGAKSGREMVRDILSARISANKRAFWLVFGKVTETWGAANAVSAIKGIAKEKNIQDWQKRSIVLMTHLDQLPAASVVERVETPLKTDGVRPFFVSLNPKNEENLEKKTPDAMKKHIEEVPAQEATTIAELKKKLGADWKEEWNQQFGVENAFDAVNKALLRTFEEMIPSFRSDLSRTLRELKDRQSQLQATLGNNEPNQMRTLLIDWIGEFCAQVRKAYKGHWTWSQEKLSPHDFNTPLPEDAGETGWKFFIPPQELMKKYATEITPQNLRSFKLDLYGGKHVNRLVDYFIILISAAAYEPFDASELEMLGAQKSLTDQDPWKVEVLAAAEYRCVKLFDGGLKWLEKEIANTLLHIVNCVADVVSEEQPAFRTTAQACANAMNENVLKTLEVAMNSIRGMVKSLCAAPQYFLAAVMSNAHKTAPHVAFPGSNHDEAKAKSPEFGEYYDNIVEPDDKVTVKLFNSVPATFVHSVQSDQTPDINDEYKNKVAKSLWTQVRSLLICTIRPLLQDKVVDVMQNGDVTTLQRAITRQFSALAEDELAQQFGLADLQDDFNQTEADIKEVQELLNILSGLGGAGENGKGAPPPAGAPAPGAPAGPTDRQILDEFLATKKLQLKDCGGGGDCLPNSLAEATKSTQKDAIRTHVTAWIKREWNTHPRRNLWPQLASQAQVDAWIAEHVKGGNYCDSVFAIIYAEMQKRPLVLYSISVDGKALEHEYATGDSQNPAIRIAFTRSQENIESGGKVEAGNHYLLVTAKP